MMMHPATLSDKWKDLPLLPSHLDEQDISTAKETKPTGYSAASSADDLIPPPQYTPEDEPTSGYRRNDFSSHDANFATAISPGSHSKTSSHKLGRLASEFQTLPLLRREYWVTEVAAFLIAVGILIAIAVILHQYERRPLSDWHAPITLNALLSVLVTVFYIMCLEIVSTCVSQLRWLHFQSSYRPLSDFQRYDKAARNIFASIRILFTRFQSSLLILAALSYIVVTAVGPFIQQILDVEIEEIFLSSNSSLPVLTDFDSTGRTNFTGLESGAARALYAGAFASKEMNFGVSASCPTGNCTWDESLATFVLRCHTIDRTGDILFADKTQAASWLKNMSVASQLGSMDQMTQLHIPDFGTRPQDGSLVSLPSSNVFAPGITVDDLSPVFADLRTQIGRNYSLDFGVFRLEPAQNCWSPRRIGSTHIFYQEMVVNGTVNSRGFDDASISYGRSGAWQVDFELALQPISAQMLNGRLVESLSADPVSYDDSKSCFGIWDVLNPHISFNFTWNERQFNVSGNSSRYIQDALEKVVGVDIAGTYLTRARDGSLSHNDSFTDISYGGHGSYGQSQWSTDFVELFYEHPEHFRNVNKNASRPLSTEKIDGIMQNVAKSLTLWLRTATGQVATGRVSTTRAVYRVTWEWIILPGVLLVMIGVLLAATVIGTRRSDVPVWTDSILAVMAHGVEDTTRDKLLAARSVEELEEISKHISVQLVEPDLVLRQDTLPAS